MLITLFFHDGVGDQPACYRVAGRQVVTNVQLSALASLEVSSPESRLLSRPISRLVSDHTVVTYRGPGWIGNAWRDFVSRSGPDGYLLDVAQSGLFSISPDGQIVAQQCVEPDAPAGLVVETLLGPALILALALQGTWCLHAGAVAIDSEAVVFLGESGKGKSTLAAFSGAAEGLEWQRLVDDVLPVTLGANSLDALPHFPQLKLPPEAQPSIGQPERMPVRAVYVLDRPAADRDEIDVRPLSKQEAALALVRHTIAARLFDKRLLTKHLEFSTDAVMHVPVYRLTYPRRYDLLPQVCAAITSNLQSTSH